MKNEWSKYAAFRVKKGMLLTLVFLEVNLASVPKYTWWIDDVAFFHISMSIKGYLWTTIKLW